MKLAGPCGRPSKAPGSLVIVRIADLPKMEESIEWKLHGSFVLLLPFASPCQDLLLALPAQELQSCFPPPHLTANSYRQLLSSSFAASSSWGAFSVAKLPLQLLLPPQPLPSFWCFRPIVSMGSWGSAPWGQLWHSIDTPVPPALPKRDALSLLYGSRHGRAPCLQLSRDTLFGSWWVQ